MEIDLNNFLIIDIETVSCVKDFEELSPRLQKLWDLKARFFKNYDTSTPSEIFKERAGIHAEFGKVVTIAAGFLRYNDADELSLRIKAFAGKNEKTILSDFKSLIESRFDEEKLTFCAHNGKEFDYPYLCRRMLINELSIPQTLQVQGKKPWEIPHLDTMEMWKFGDRKAFTSLELLAAIFGIDSSKSDLDGSKVNQAYYEENALDKIATYCMQDVLVTTQLFLKLRSLPPIKEENIEYVEEA